MILGILASAIQQISGSADPLWKNVFALLHVESDSPKDSGPAGRLVSGSIPTTDIAKFPGKALDLSKNGGAYLQIAGSNAPGMKGDLTLEFFIYIPTSGLSGNLFYFKPISGNVYGISYYIRGNGSLAAYTPSRGFFAQADLSPYIGSWTHFAITSANSANGSDTHSFFINGKLIITGQISSSNNDALDYVSIGAAPNSDVPVSAGVYIDEIRITQAIRYTANFVPPSEPFPNTGP